MPYQPKCADPIRVPLRWVRDLVFAWPGRTDPGPFIGVGDIGSIGTAPDQFFYAASHMPTGATTAFTLSAVVTNSGTPFAGGAGILVSFVQSHAIYAPGLQLSIDSGAMTVFEQNSAGTSTSLVVSVSTVPGSVLRTIVAHNGTSSLLSVMVNGTVVASGTGAQAWTQQGTLTIGLLRASTLIWSGGISDVYLFGRTLSAQEQRLLDLEWQ